MSVPLDQPHYGIGPAGMVRWLRKYASFRGRASRAEFWWGQLTMLLLSFVLLLPGIIAFVVVFAMSMERYTADPATTPAAPFQAFADAGWGFVLILVGSFLWLGTTVPWLALAWRRVQDAGMHGAFALLFLLGGTLLAGWLVVTALAQYVPGFLTPSARGARFESSPTPVLPPDVTQEAWDAERAWAQQRAAGWAQQQQQWVAPPAAWPQHAYPQQPWPQQAYPVQPWPQQPHSQQPGPHHAPQQPSPQPDQQQPPAP